MANLRQTYSLAHSARCKLHLAADRPDRDLRFLVGHAMHLDSLLLRIVEIEESGEESEPVAAVEPKTSKPSKQPLTPNHDGSDEDPLYDEDEEDLGLTRFPSGSAAPPRRLQDIQVPGLIPSDDDESSSDEEEDYSDLLRELISKNGGGDEGLAKMYHDIKTCPCHNTDAPEIERVWELPSEKTGVRKAAVEVRG